MQTIILECMCAKSFQLCLFATLCTAACQVALSMGFSRQEYWSGLPCSQPGELSDPGMEPISLMPPEFIDGFLTTSAPGKPKSKVVNIYFLTFVPSLV